MEDDEVPHLLELQLHHPVVLGGQQRLEIPVWKQSQKPRYASLDQVDTGRLEWLEEARRKAERHDIADPLSPSAPRDKPERPRLRQGLAFQAVQQGLKRRLV